MHWLVTTSFLNKIDITLEGSEAKDKEGESLLERVLKMSRDAEIVILWRKNNISSKIEWKKDIYRTKLGLLTREVENSYIGVTRKYFIKIWKINLNFKFG
jgi:hypothetical protein